MRVRTDSSDRVSAAAPEAVFLVGFMGAGKSSVGAALAHRLNWVFEDLDDRIERRERRSVAQIFRRNANTTRTTSAMEIISVIWTSLMEALMVDVRSFMTDSLMSGGMEA